MTKLCLSRQTIFVATNIILLQQCFCHDKHTFVTTKVCLFVMTNKHTFVATNTWQTEFCCNKSFVATSILLSQRKTCFIRTNTRLSRQTCICHDKTFVSTKIILVAAPANDSKRARSNTYPIQIGSEALAESGPDDFCIPVCFRTRATGWKPDTISQNQKRSRLVFTMWTRPSVEECNWVWKWETCLHGCCCRVVSCLHCCC